MLAITLGADPASPSPTLPLAQMTHDIVPYLGKPIYLRLVRERQSRTAAQNYAAAGFHVSVTRATAGGCGDAALAVDGTDKSAACKLPKGRADLAAKWQAAARAYFTAFNNARTSTPFPDVITSLEHANRVADEAYAAEGLDPPRDPLTRESQGAVRPSEGFSLGTMSLVAGGVAAAGLLFWGVFKGPKDEDERDAAEANAKIMMGASSRPRRARRRRHRR